MQNMGLQLWSMHIFIHEPRNSSRQHLFVDSHDLSEESSDPDEEDDEYDEDGASEADEESPIDNQTVKCCCCRSKSCVHCSFAFYIVFCSE